MNDLYLCKRCKIVAVPKNERDWEYAYYPYYEGYLCRQCINDLKEVLPDEDSARISSLLNA